MTTKLINCEVIIVDNNYYYLKQVGSLFGWRCELSNAIYLHSEG